MVLEDLMRMIIDGLHGLSHCSQLLSSLNAYIPGARMLFPVSTLSILEVITSSASHSHLPLLSVQNGDHSSVLPSLLDSDHMQEGNNTTQIQSMWHMKEYLETTVL